MPVLPRSIVVILGCALFAAPAAAANPPEQSCLTRAEQRAAVAANKAIRLTDAVKSMRKQGHHAEVVRARLCRHGEELVYVLTLLGHSGKVLSVNIDAGHAEPASH
jgi:hypothetical protein